MPGYRKNNSKRMRMRCNPPNVSWPYFDIPPQPPGFGMQPAMFCTPPVMTLAIQQLALQQLAFRQQSQLQQQLQLQLFAPPVSSSSTIFPPNLDNISHVNNPNLGLDQEIALVTSVHTSQKNNISLHQETALEKSVPTYQGIPTAPDCQEVSNVAGNANGDEIRCVICLIAPPEIPTKCDRCVAVSCWLCLDMWLAHAGKCPMC
ncbi:uncharacterized protein LOC127749031 [Frankliniella occidentalis]|uniref:Uncharacterized protein LOC127749031 n=1 Tax=Frankliniella occidentalis TaxID=133901 RepID=A0A9C6U4B1_FRAOC|nr:uncharacterized protein LOC127749031 [Frankliniella occidentalis]